MVWYEVIKKLRLDKGLTQREVADIINIRQASYSKYETGDSQPKIETIIFLADFYGVSTDYLLGRVKYSLKANKELKNLLTKIQNDIDEIKKAL